MGDMPILKPISYDERHEIKDFKIPLMVKVDKASGAKRYVIDEERGHESFCYVGDLEPRRIFDAHDRKIFNWFLEIYGKSEAELEERDDFRIEHDGQFFRAHRKEASNSHWLIVRALPHEPPTLDQLAIPPAWRFLLTDQGLLYGGLVLITATNGMGKTTLASATVRSRLERYKGTCNTVEAPPELPLEGWWGEGHCLQAQPDYYQDGERRRPNFGAALEELLRDFPTGGRASIVFVGEIRDSAAAAASIQAASNGHLVIATTHGGSPHEALRRLVTMATGTDEMRTPEAAREALAASLRFVIGQTLTLGSGERKDKRGWERGEITGDVLYVRTKREEETPAVDLIEKGDWAKLKELTVKQNRLLKDVTSREQVYAALRKAHE